MIQKIGNYYLKQDINSADGLIEFSDDEYIMAEQVGMKRILEDEKQFYGIDSEFASISWGSTMIGSTKGKIYKIALQDFSEDKKSAKKKLKTVLEFLYKEIGKYSEHPFLSDKYIWDTSDGNIILNKQSRFNVHSVNIIFTSNFIKEPF